MLNMLAPRWRSELNVARSSERGAGGRSSPALSKPGLRTTDMQSYASLVVSSGTTMGVGGGLHVDGGGWAGLSTLKLFDGWMVLPCSWYVLKTPSHSRRSARRS
jgi:hypothetical protein